MTDRSKKKAAGSPQPEDAGQEKAASPKKKRPRRRKKSPESTGESCPETSAKKKPAEKKAPVKKRKKADAESKTEAGGFQALGLSDEMLGALKEIDYLEPTPVQAGVIPQALKGIDLMGQAQTGTGKTAAFGIPILEQLGTPRTKGQPQALVLVPTRELAVQVRDEIAKLAHGRRVHVVALYGGKPIRKQTEQLHRGTDVIVGTPGRVIDHMSRRTLVLDSLCCVVLDEADRMLDIGFRPDIEKILRRCPQSRQTLLLSATIPPPVARLATRYMRDPEKLDFSTKDVAVETIEQFYYTVDPRRKFDLLVRLMQREEPDQAIIFCRTRRGTEKVGERLGRKFKAVGAIHGDLPQRTRDRVMAGFREGKIRFLAATDVVGRGIDVSGISHIINYDIPQFCDDYIHRVGRTGRMGREGVAYTFVSPEQGSELTRIEMRINRLLKREEMPDFDPNAREDREGSTSAATPTQQPETPTEEPKPKPVFGRKVRRLRRAL